MTDILSTDVWMVTHVFKGLYMIESKEYQERECRLKIDGGPTLFSDTCHSRHLFAIYTDPAGKLVGGWQLLPGPDKLFSERDVYLDPSPDKTRQWPADFGFSAQPSGN